MKGIIKSTKADEDLLRLEATNYMNTVYEMIGIYQHYLIVNDIGETFADFYRNYRGTTEYHYSNKGIYLVARLLQQKNVNVSRRNIRRLGRTYRGYPVILSKIADIIIITAIEYISSIDSLNEVYRSELYNGNIENPLMFQYELLVRYARRRGERGLNTPFLDTIDQLNWGAI